MLLRRALLSLHKKTLHTKTLNGERLKGSHKCVAQFCHPTFSIELKMFMYNKKAEYEFWIISQIPLNIQSITNIQSNIDEYLNKVILFMLETDAFCLYSCEIFWILPHILYFIFNKDKWNPPFKIIGGKVSEISGLVIHLQLKSHLNAASLLTIWFLTSKYAKITMAE